MLVLTRKLQQQIRISDNITITVLRVKGNTVRLGIDAPRQVRVVRGEIPSFDGPPALEGQEQPATVEIPPQANQEPNCPPLAESDDGNESAAGEIPLTSTNILATGSGGPLSNRMTQLLSHPLVGNRTVS